MLIGGGEMGCLGNGGIKWLQIKETPERGDCGAVFIPVKTCRLCSRLPISKVLFGGTAVTCGYLGLCLKRKCKVSFA